MDWIFGLGYAQVKEHNNRLEVQPSASSTVQTYESHSGIAWDLGMKFYIDDSFSIRTDLTSIYYSAIKATSTASAYYSNYDATVSLGYAF